MKTKTIKVDPHFGKLLIRLALCLAVLLAAGWLVLQYPPIKTPDHCSECY